MEQFKRLAGSLLVTIIILTVLVLIGAAGILALVYLLQYPKVLIALFVAAFIASCWNRVHNGMYH